MKTDNHSPSDTARAETNAELTINGKPLEPLGVDVDLNNRTVTFTQDGVEYPAGIGAELLSLTREYEELTTDFEYEFGTLYRFRPDDTESKPWFHRADFWPYTDDSSENLYHYIRYAYTHPRDTEITLNISIERDEIAYPFDTRAVIAFFDPDEKRVRVFGSDDSSARSAGDISRRVFQPTVNLYAAFEKELLQLRVRAKPYQDPRSEDNHDLAEIDAGHLDSPYRASVTGKNITWNPTEYSVTGPVFDVMKREAASSFRTARPGSFNAVHALFLDSHVDTPDTSSSL